MRWIDLPPVWLALFAVAAYAQARWLPTPFPETLGNDLGALAILVGLLFTVAALVQFRRHRTPIMPRRRAERLITTGVFSKSRNPIYLADALFLAGLSLWWGSVLGLLLVPVFMTLISRRFIAGEEAQLRADHGAAFEEYARTTRRWL